LFEVYEKITGENAYKVPMRIYPAVHYTMGGLWVDYDLMSNVPGLFVIGEANFLITVRTVGASALMQGLADGYFVLPNTLPNYLAMPDGKTALAGCCGVSTSRGRCPRQDRETPEGQWHALLDHFTENSAFFSGTNAECRATRKGCAKRSKKSQSCDQFLA